MIHGSIANATPRTKMLISREVPVTLQNQEMRFAPLPTIKTGFMSMMQPKRGPKPLEPKLIGEN
jgi:hypothetical protein